MIFVTLTVKLPAIRVTRDALFSIWVTRFTHSPTCFHPLARVFSTFALSGGSPLFLYSDPTLALDSGHLVAYRRMIRRPLGISLKALTLPPSTVLVSWAVLVLLAK